MENPPPDALIASTMVSSSASGSWMVCSGMVPLTSWVTLPLVVLAGKSSVAVPGFRTTSVSSLVASFWPFGSKVTVTVTGVVVAVLATTLAFRVTVIVTLAPSATRDATSTFRPLPSNVLSGVSCAAASPLPRARTTASSVAHFELLRSLFKSHMLPVSAPVPRTCTPLHAFCRRFPATRRDSAVCVLTRRHSGMSGEEMQLLCNIEWRFEDGRWQVLREQIFLRPLDE